MTDDAADRPPLDPLPLLRALQAASIDYVDLDIVPSGDVVADDVDWTVEGTHPLAGSYHDKRQFLEATFTRLQGVLREGVKLEVKRLYVDGDTAIAELHSTSTTNEGAAFDNNYCWVCRFEGDMIVEVRAYLDSTMVTYAVLRNENARK